MVEFNSGSARLKAIEQAMKEPFAESEIEWRPQRIGFGHASGKPYCMVLAYVDARALQERLDQVFGPFGWMSEYRVVDVGGKMNMICRLSVKNPDGDNAWTWKEDGAPETDIEAFKGGLSSAFKRVCASGFGMGRYLYSLPETFAECSLDKPSEKIGWNRADTKNAKGERVTIYWKTPSLPAWAKRKE